MKRRYGFIREKLEIKILVLFVLRRIPEPVTIEELTELIMGDEGISYFDFMECVTDLVSTKHLRFNDNKYYITQKGARNGAITENSLHHGLRTQMENTAFLFRNKQSRNALIRTFHDTNPSGSCTVKLSLSDGIGEVVAMELFAVNEQQALSLEKGFRKNAENVYNKLIEIILE